MKTSNIEIRKGDITSAEVDAIVNAANPAMLGGGGVDGAIHRAAGPALLEACKQVRAINGVRCPTGQARITQAGNLKAKYVIHTVGPVYSREQNPSGLLQSAYENSLALAKQFGCKTIAFPAISCGVYGYPIGEAAELAIDVCNNPKYADMTIQFYLFDDAALKAWRQALERIKGH